MTPSKTKRRKTSKAKTPRPPVKTERQARDRFIPGFIPGFHAVRETLKEQSGTLEEIWVTEGKPSARIEEILNLAKSQNIPIYFKQQFYLSELFEHIAHQGIVGITKAFAYADLSQVLRHSLQKGALPLLLVADHITDPGNLGALIRTAAFFGGHGLIIPKDRSAAMTPAALKRASGAHFKLPVIRVTNLGRALDDLSEKGFWIIGATGGAQLSIYDFDWNRPLVLALGNEQKGLSPSVLKRCHEQVRIPSPGGVESLNISVAG
ncbi:MAG TPA: 23S rRNA (guanosine(2251)-2'-O)-methyltransferase RlmB, partial [Desulfobacteria bacterium]|nr:23S rRNA (guanosine(2251)-2'-O)-methyltransferase RlmB [Desulfobacteria bacterium]